ncbi:MAG: hypothetical protein KBT29_10350 [Prevotellaceae bacterium]|nr:hypothetical protein [Candidatus Minthosoma caballi]
MDKKILNESGAEYPFKVPEGYFDNLTARIMDAIPEDDTETEKKNNNIISINANKKTETGGLEKKRTWTKVLKIAASLAIVAAVSFKLIPFLTDNSVDTNSQIASADYFEEDQYSQDFMKYTMVDNSDIYDYLAGYED